MLISGSRLEISGYAGLLNNSAFRGGAVCCNFGSNTVIFGNISFTRNTANDGGAIGLSDSTCNISGNVTFNYNTASVNGGAISAISGSSLTITGNISFTQNNANDGGAIALFYSTCDISGNVIFNVNTASVYGGAISKTEGSHTISGIVSFIDNIAAYGGALRVNGIYHNNINIIIISGTISFARNLATSDGGAVLVSVTSGSTSILGNVSFVENTAGSNGGAISMTGSSNDISGNITFMRNEAVFQGGALAMFGGAHNLSGIITFANNKGDSGAAIHMSGGSHTITGNISFVHNTATMFISVYGGGAMSFTDGNHTIFGYITFFNNTAREVNFRTMGSGAVYISRGSHSVTGNISFVGNTGHRSGAIFISSGIHNFSGSISFINNSASFGSGGALVIDAGSTILSGSILFLSNKAFKGGAMYIVDGNHSVSGNISFINNRADERGGAIAVHTTRFGETTLNLTGLVRFEHNSAQRGGAMAFYGRYKYTLLLSDPIQIEFIENHANSTGGALHFEEGTTSKVQCETLEYLHIPVCFLELSSKTYINLYFNGNTAGNAGTILYGGALDSCKIYTGGGVRDSCGNIVGGSYSNNSINTIRSISNIISSDKLTSDISSDPVQVCFCMDDGNIVCDAPAEEVKTVPGKKITLKVVIIGQDKGIVPSSVRISLDNDVQINASERIQVTGKECIDLTYHLFSGINTTTVSLFPNSGTCQGIGKSSTYINVTFLPCPDGFKLRRSECVCEDRLQQFNATCNVNQNSIERISNSFWMGTIYDNKTYVGLILHSGGCPFDFCIDTPVSITLDNLDVQCNHNHSGTLCGPCKENHSIALGTLHCLDCSNAYLALILPFALAGVVLVAVLLLLNLSVAVGTVNGLIFYANVVQANRSIFFPLGETNILTVFISWLNLDLGIETCFYDGMDAYAFTWLQFLFPFYVWILIGLIIIASRYSRKIAQSLGNNPVPTLATLFLLSYSKILRNIIAALSVTSLDYPDGTSELVWLYDGSVLYFQRADHNVLGIFAISVLLLLFLPYTLLLLLGQCLQAYSHHRMLSWMNKIKPFMDAYHAPYKKETRYWTGLILLVRCVLFLTFAVNSLQVGDNHFDLLFTTTVTACLGALAWIHHGVYEKVHNDILEASFILNLCIFSAATFHMKESGGNQAALAYTSVGIAFATFALIFLYHVYLIVCKTLIWMKFIQFLKVKNDRPLSDQNNVDEENLKGATAPVDVTTTILELREPLLTPEN